MDLPVLLWPMGALLICWLVGVHNRLRRLRSACWLAVDNLDRSLQSLLQVAKEALDRPDPASRAHEVLTVAALQLSLSLKTMRSAKLMAGRDDESSAVGAHWSELQAAWQNFGQAHAEIIETTALEQLCARWDEAHNHALFSKTTANQAMVDYNAAIRQAPARWVAGRLGFVAATPL
jgi:LemA protein